MAYDANRSTVVMFGGNTGVTELADTWEMTTSDFLTFPPAMASVEGNADCNVPFGPMRSRLQVVMEVDGFGPQRSALVKGLELRRNQGTEHYAARRIDLEVRLGFARVRAAAMSSTFRDNWSGTPSLVFVGKLSLPQQPAVAVGPAAFDVRIPFSSTFTWNGEDLACELRADKNTVPGVYLVDAVVQPPPAGAAHALGQACAGPNGVARYARPDVQQLVPGGAIDNSLQNATPSTLAINFLGGRTDRWGNLALPFTWPGTHCTIYNDLVVDSVVPVQDDGSAFWRWTLPKDPAIAGLSVYSQWGIFEGPQVAQPFTFTNAYKLTVGPNLPVRFDSIFNADHSETGSNDPRGRLVPVLRFVD